MIDPKNNPALTGLLYGGGWKVLEAQIIGSAQSVAPNGRPLTVFTASSSLWRGEIATGVTPVWPSG